MYILLDNDKWVVSEILFEMTRNIYSGRGEFSIVRKQLNLSFIKNQNPFTGLDCGRSGGGPSYLWQSEKIHCLHTDVEHSGDLTVSHLHSNRHSASARHRHHFVYRSRHGHGTSQFSLLLVDENILTTRKWFFFGKFSIWENGQNFIKYLHTDVILPA